MSAAEAAAYSSNTGTTPLPSLNMDKFRAFTNQVTSQVTPFAARSQQWIKEQTGTVAEKTELPHDYLELEVRVDALKTTHQKLLAATSQYTNEAYDYPPNVKESFQDLGKSISDKVHLAAVIFSSCQRMLTQSPGQPPLQGLQRSRSPSSPHSTPLRQTPTQDISPRHRSRRPRRLPGHRNRHAARLH